jgi:hypothetical protein
MSGAAMVFASTSLGGSGPLILPPRIELREDPIEKLLVVILRGDDVGIETMVAKDVEVLTRLFAHQDYFDVRVLPFQLVDQPTLFDAILGELKRYERVLLWYTGHGMSLGGRWPSVAVKGGTMLMTEDLYRSVCQALSERQWATRGFTFIIDACNSVDRYKSAKLDSVVLPENIGLPSLAFWESYGKAYMISSKNAEASKGTMEGSYFTNRLVFEILTSGRLEQAFYNTRYKLISHEPEYKAEFAQYFESTRTLTLDDILGQS